MGKRSPSSSPLIPYPSRLKACVFRTPWGWMGLSETAEGIDAVVLPKTSRQAVLSELQAASAELLARIIHDGSWRNRVVATRDRRAELQGREAYLKQYVDRPSGEPACLDAGPPRPGLSQRRIRDWSRSVHE